MSDLDGDSHMHSSSSSDAADDSDAMFPSELDSPGHAPQNSVNPLASSLLPAGSTPPLSQDQDDAMDMGPLHSMNPGEEETAVRNGITMKTVPWTRKVSPRKVSPGDLASGEKSDFAISAEMAEPGASWNNRKAKEEYQRVSMQIEDKNFSLREFGDLFDEGPQSPENGKDKGKQ
ncbi:hypothetical protein N7G274_003816 [Stereocaulon virgatum]|uniref:Uncharacterized protein n=1 Tax=Stereocaulon virgatum TaxID=373712 RepID=A0ABR4ADF4_9LECA